jgi:hypothetical protein
MIRCLALFAWPPASAVGQNNYGVRAVKAACVCKMVNFEPTQKNFKPIITETVIVKYVYDLNKRAKHY